MLDTTRFEESDVDDERIFRLSKRASSATRQYTLKTVKHANNWQELNRMNEEIKDAIKDLKIRKSPGNDQVTAEMIKYGGENVEVFYNRLCTKIWHEKKWPDDWGQSVFVPILKKGDTLQCSNNRTFFLISHSSKMLLKIIAKQMTSKLNEETAKEQAGFRPGKGTRDQIMNLKMILEKNRERN
ncbi:uncharacterized protein LOC134776840 [Penaeus indicus]|uniref:uncharacterized protein LOC134776840 n=1 Tax=Penaeus indicus TaxID=29960 RepID=UPI00300C21D2